MKVFYKLKSVLSYYDRHCTLIYYQISISNFFYVNGSSVWNILNLFSTMLSSYISRIQFYTYTISPKDKVYIFNTYSLNPSINEAVFVLSQDDAYSKWHVFSDENNSSKHQAITSSWNKLINCLKRKHTPHTHTHITKFKFGGTKLRKIILVLNSID